MGTRINVLFAHELSDWTNREESLQILAQTLPSVKVLEDYWRKTDPSSSPEPKTWIAEPPYPPPEHRNYFRYTGPGRSLFVSINTSAVWIRTGGRWRGFLSIPRLREVHLAAFRALTKSFHAKTLYCFADNDFGNDVFWDGGGVSDCITILQQQLGDPIEMQDSIDPTAVKAAEHGCPRLWYRDDLF